MIRFLILTAFLLLFSICLFADAEAIRIGVLSNMPEFAPNRTPSISHGNFYGIDDTAIIAVRYDLPTFEFSLSPEKVQVTYFTKVTLAFAGYPSGNKIVIDWGESGGSTSTIYAPSTNNCSLWHQYSSTVQAYNVSIKTYRPSGASYIEEPEHETNLTVGIFPYDASEDVATINGEAVGTLYTYQTSIASSIKKPVLIVEGFNWHNNNTASSIIGLNPFFYQNLLSDGFDLYILTFANSHNSLFVNAGLVLSALDRIKAHFDDGGDMAGYGCKPIKIIGYSMGGVLARIALASAEDQNGYAHGTNLLITVDSPHRGFVINSNLQNSFGSFINTINFLLPGDQEVSDELVDGVNSLLYKFACINPNYDYSISRTTIAGGTDEPYPC
ncbi:MAG: hypothetical protein Q8M98_08370 [Candidatus Cloacimonadaceae bacterium]|nr:hypothetical protein [Candidatus Cloacimonadaceae bacterium]